MKKLLFGCVLAAALVIGLGGPVRARAQSSVDDFVIKQYLVDMELGRDSESRSTLTTKLTITADFLLQRNRGIAPFFVKEYNGHPTDFRLVSVTDEQGTPLKHHWHGNELRIGEKGTFVSGQKTYVITYTQRDVTRFYEDTGRDEFYWDAIGTAWRVPIEMVTVSLQLSPELKAAAATKADCYKGTHGSREHCGVGAVVGGGEIYEFDSSLRRGEGMTVVIGFQKGTFQPYQQSLQEKLRDIWSAAQTIAMPVAGGLAALIVRMSYVTTGRKKELGVIVPEYLPPQRVSVTAAAAVVRHFSMVRGSVMSAQLLDLAVRHFIRIYEVKPKRLLFAAEYEVEVVQSPDGLMAEEQELLSDMFGHMPVVGDKLNLKTLKNNMQFASRTRDNDKKVDTLLVGDYHLKERRVAYTRKFRLLAAVFAVIGLVLLSPFVLILALLTFVLSFNKVLTDEGLVLRRYLMGLKEYIEVAEADRLRMLQSPEGAEKLRVAGIDGGVNNQKNLVKLYERVLPYAVLFGQEKQWSKQLGQYYDQAGTQPDWYRGSHAFNAAAFASGISNMNEAASRTSGYSSSSGGSSGGGFSGGGGGGGGGGGW